MRGGIGFALVATALLLPSGAAAATPGDAGRVQRPADQSHEPGPPAEVRVGALINDIEQLDLQAHTYNMDVYLWFKWRDPDIHPSRTFEYMNAFEFWGRVTRETPKPERLPDGSYYEVVRDQGEFNAKLPLGRYPFDTQHLLVEIEDGEDDSRDLRFVPDGKDAISLSPQLTLPGWEIGRPTLKVVDNQYSTDFGDPAEPSPTYSRVVMDVPVTRPYATYAMKLLLPIALVVLTAALALSVHPRYVEGRIGIGITALLTLVALQLTSNQTLPEVNYLLLLDQLYIASYAFAVLVLALIVRHSWVDAESDIAASRRADRRGLAVLLGLYLLTCAVMLLIALT